MTTLRIVGSEEQHDRYDLYDVYFYTDKIKTMVTSDPDMVTQWIQETETINKDHLNNLIIGIDIEWRPSFSRSQQNRVAVLQLCNDRRCLIFQLLYCSCIPESLVNFLGNREYKFVGVGVENDVEKLLEDHELGVSNAVDLKGLAVEAFGVRKDAGLKELCNVVLGREVDKPKRVTMGRWDCEWLSMDQVQYACLDAFVSFEIGRRLISPN